MKAYVMTDMEGISGIVNVGQVRPGDPAYAEGRRLLAGDVNAAIAGAFVGGAESVTVADGHGGGFHLPIAEMGTRARYERPCTGRDRQPDMSVDVDMLIAIGMHAMSGTPKAFLEHTQSSVNWHRYLIDGAEYGEIGQDAFYAGGFGVPLVFVSGDLAATEEARKLVPEVETVAVKEGIGRDWCRSLAPERAHELIRSGVAHVAARCRDIPPTVLDFPVEVRVEFNRCSGPDEYENKPGYRRIDGFTIEWTANSIRELLPY